MDTIQKLAYDAGKLAGSTVVVPFIDGMMDQVEPLLVRRTQKVAKSAIPTLPDWVKRYI